MANSLDMWVVQLDELIQHAIKIRNQNVMEYKDKELEAFETGLNIFTLLMKEMVKDMVEQRGKDYD
tara:strand:- start:4435 stop:4632 length:198 start_codon:yes stop_codon:yes gene_type:complete